MADRSVGLRDVLILAATCVAIVVGAALLTSLLPAEAQSVVFRTPLLIVVLIGGTAVALWRIARPRGETAPAARRADDTGADSPDRSTGG